MPPTIYLVGPMTSGKSTIGKLLAQSLGILFFDTDREIEKKSGVEVAWIFDEEGEKGFRERETAILKYLSQISDKKVIATGGGTILKEENRDIMQKTGFIIFLDLPVSVQYERTLKDKKRPLLQKSKDRFQTLQKIYQERKVFYQSIANLIMKTGHGSPHVLVNKIIKAMK